MVKSSNLAYNNIRGEVIMPTVFQILIHPNVDIPGYWAECPQLAGCNTQGNSFREINKRIIEAIELCLEDHTEQIDDYILDFEVCNA